MTLLWSSANGSERGSCEGTLQNFQDAAFARTAVSQVENVVQVSSNTPDKGTRWSSGIFGMGNPFRPHTRQSRSRSPSWPSVVVRRASTSSSSQHPHHHHHHQQQYDPTPSQYITNQPPTTHHALSPASTPGEGERSTKRLKLTVRKPEVASPATRNSYGHGQQSAKKDDDPLLSDITHNHNSPRPPTRLTVTEPHGKVVQTTNGVQTTLNVTAHGLRTNNPSRATTAEPLQKESRKSAERRSLRSHDEGPRLKSELAVYFPDYEEVIYDAPKEPEILTPESVIVIVDEPDIPPTKPKTKAKEKAKVDDKNTIHRYLISPRSLASTSTNVPSPSHDRNRFNGAQVVDFSTIEKSVGHHPRDPLTDGFYFKSHRRAERKEKQLRNIEKERAMHEKAQLERLLDGLEGHDWLRVMGITGVTDSESRKFEPKRDYFISEVKALLLKFKTWKEEERRLKLEKEAALAAEEEEEEEEEEDEEDDSAGDSVVSGDEKVGHTASDFDHAAARQLQMEASDGGAKGRGGKGGKGKGRERVPPHPPRPPPPVVYRPPTPDGPFTSFYSKPHLRAAALGKSRHGRKLTAFGLPIPETEEQEFKLPLDYMTADAIKESARRRRRMKRESFVEGGVKKP